MSTPDGLPPLREVVERHGLMARKALGQNFLFDLNLTRRIARSAGSLAGMTVVEVGPGPGGLTRALCWKGPSASSPSNGTSAACRRWPRSARGGRDGSRSSRAMRWRSISLRFLPVPRRASSPTFPTMSERRCSSAG